ncbi:hypothetical protein [Hydrogenophaga pseudoflava]|uniref:hypothetical protein n=1 Tax=Hydrogenophaga pseudoflava TaxID=47421 RepID=UPI0027E3BB00|nr:hypothetical protein [Hydrogenophaga pseudoflava]MDQ7743782.1 hypothetical protein [Hydrogenophaga pseudoflava]
MSSRWCVPLLDFVALKKVDTKSKTVVYCEASLITELLKALGEAGEEDAPVAASIGQKVSD